MSGAFEYWEDRYRSSGRSWSGNVNAALEREITGVAPGTALDLGSGEGGDALWLARNGWSVTAVDISPTALAIGEARQRPGDDIRWVAADLSTWQPPETYDLVTSCFLHSSVELPRETILRRAAEAVAPSGLLLIVGHADKHPHQHIPLPSPDEVLANLHLGAAEWTVLTNATVDRTATMPDGSTVDTADSVLKLLRS